MELVGNLPITLVFACNAILRSKVQLAHFFGMKIQTLERYHSVSKSITVESAVSGTTSA